MLEFSARDISQAARAGIAWELPTRIGRICSLQNLDVTKYNYYSSNSIFIHNVGNEILVQPKPILVFTYSFAFSCGVSSPSYDVMVTTASERRTQKLSSLRDGKNP